MLHRLRLWWDRFINSLWILPAAIVVGGVVLASVLVEFSPGLSDEVISRYPRLFGAGADGARGMLSTIASSMITVAGVTFSITIAAVAQTSAQYTPRVLRTFMGDRANQAVLGTFVGIFAYCLVVLRTIRSGNEGSFVPPTAVLGGFLFALVGVGVLVYFIVHITQSLQAASILNRVSHETVEAVDRLFPARLGTPAAEVDDSTRPTLAALRSARWHLVCSDESGYIEGIDDDGLLTFARERGLVVRMELGVGDFAVAGAPLAAVTPVDPDAQAQRGANTDEDKSVEDALNALYSVSAYRTVAQDAAFGILQIVDVALKGLSPGINDTTTAVTCVGHLTAVLAAVAQRHIPDPIRVEDSHIRVIAVGPTFASLVATAFDDVRRSAGNNVTVLRRILDGLDTVGFCTANPERRRVLIAHVDHVVRTVEREIKAPEDQALLKGRAEVVRRRLAAPLTDEMTGGLETIDALPSGMSTRPPSVASEPTIGVAS